MDAHDDLGFGLVVQAPGLARHQEAVGQRPQARDEQRERAQRVGDRDETAAGDATIVAEELVFDLGPFALRSFLVRF